MPMMIAKIIVFGQVRLRPPKSLWRRFLGFEVGFLVGFLVEPFDEFAFFVIIV